MTAHRLITTAITCEQDVVFARQRTRQVAQLLGFDPLDQTRLATAVSELGRNAFEYAGGGNVEFSVGTPPEPLLQITVVDHGPGIAKLQAILDGEYKSQTGLGLGILGTRRLMDSFAIDTRIGEGTRIALGKSPARRHGAPHVLALADLARRLAEAPPLDAASEVSQQNHELMVSLAELHARNDAISAANVELAETNRGVVALYAELDERADFLRRANDIKTRFLSSMTHELRTPVNSILSLSGLLLQRFDGPLTAEQEKQVRFIVSSAESLAALIEDLLDHAKAEAGKVEVRAQAFSLTDMLGALRGTLRPLLAASAGVDLIFEEAPGLPNMISDEGKVTQILRNLVSNAIKFTEQGKIVVSAGLAAEECVVFCVEDTGIGIGLVDQDRVFEDFVQLDSPQQRRSKGTGLGLPLARRLAELLGGSLRLESRLGIGSVFELRLPLCYRPTSSQAEPELRRTLDATRDPVLIVGDDANALVVYERALLPGPYQMLAARDVVEAQTWVDMVRPAAILIDVARPDEQTWRWLQASRVAAKMRDVPLLMASQAQNEPRARQVGADIFAAKPVSANWLPQILQQRLRSSACDVVLIIDDDPIARYTLRHALQATRFVVHEADNVADGLVKARALRPKCVVLDLIMPGDDGFAGVQAFAGDPMLCEIPVLVCTSQHLSEHDSQRLRHAAGTVPKHAVLGEAGLVAAMRLALARERPWQMN